MPSKPNNAARQQPKSTKTWIASALIILGVVIVFLLVTQNSGQVYSFSATTVTGEQVSLSDYRGKVVMLNFWATWCPPCRAEMPGIETVYQQYHDQGFVVLAVNNAERMEQVSSFANNYGLTFPVLLDYSAEIQKQFGISGYPTSLFLDAKGKVYAIHPGAATIAQLMQYVETGLQRSAS